MGAKWDDKGIKLAKRGHTHRMRPLLLEYWKNEYDLQARLSHLVLAEVLWGEIFQNISPFFGLLVFDLGLGLWL